MINKTSFLLILCVSLFSCTTKKVVVLEKKPLYDILLRKEDGGAKFRFYEIISEQKEFRMIANDEFIKPYLEKEEFKKANFILVNLGLKSHPGYQIQVKEATEKADKIVLKIIELEPKIKDSLTIGDYTPNYVIRVKSKKPIEIIE